MIYSDESIPSVDQTLGFAHLNSRRDNWPILVYNILRAAKTGAKYQSIYDDLGGCNRPDMEAVRNVVAQLVDQGVAVVYQSRIYSYKWAPKGKK